MNITIRIHDCIVPGKKTSSLKQAGLRDISKRPPAVLLFL
jgi:hypothetical protein